MLKRFKKKFLFLFLVIAALTRFGSTSPMLSDPCKQTSNETKITDLPLDCWYVIFPFVEPKNIRPPCALRLVCKYFKDTVQKTTLSLELNCKGKDIDKFPNISLLFGNVKNLTLKNYNLSSLEKELKKLINLTSLTMFNCEKFNGTGLKELINLQQLKVQYCHQFYGKELEKLINLQQLKVQYCNQFDETSNTIKKLKKRGCKVTFQHNNITVIDKNRFTPLPVCQKF